MCLIPPSFCRFDNLCAVHHQKVLHPQKETPIFFAQGSRRGKHRDKRETSSHRWTKDSGVSHERIWGRGCIAQPPCTQEGKADH
jgi:hypothetical protein